MALRPCLLLLLVSATCTAIPLLQGRFETTTDVQDYLNLAIDAAEMREATDLAVKKSIYQNGFQSDSTSNSADRITLQSLSLNANVAMAQSPMFNIFRHAFLELGNFKEGETEGQFDGYPVEQYGDTLVNDLFSIDDQDSETEAAMVTIVWMAAVHELFQVLQECKASNAQKALAALDRAAALWVGEGQVEGSNDEGHLLYFLAENAGERFDQDDGETLVNTQLMSRFTSLQTDLQNGNCDTIDGYLDMRTTVRRMIGLMTIPLVQNIIHYSKMVQSAGTSSSFVELYSLATIPRVAACDPSAYDEELQLDVLRALKPNQVDASIAAIQKAYGCLDITCADVGTYLGGVVPACQDDATATAAGYSTDRDGAKSKMNLDRDVKAIDIFLRFEAYGAAEDWYMYGWNSDVSLQALAQNQVIPATSGNSYISIFQRYYAEENFADNLITNALQLVPPYNSAGKEQIRNTVGGLLKHVVMFMSSATALQYAIEQCVSDTTTALTYWDTGAVFYIGSMEGPDVNGNAFGGEFLFTTAKNLCVEFGTCTTPPQSNGGLAVAAVNQKIVQGFNNAVDSINSGSCSDAQSILENTILPAMIVPLIQGMVKYASYNANLATGTSDASLAIGDTYARGILPIVDQSNPDSASTILSNMQFQLSTQPVPQGFPTVANAMRSALQEMSTSCSDVGQFEDEPIDGNMCPGGSGGRGDSGDISNLAWGRYTFQDLDAAEDSTFALDVRDMRSEDLTTANSTYYNGKNYVGAGLYGYDVTTLSGLSVELADDLKSDPIFGLYRYAVYGDQQLDDDTSPHYANDVVRIAFDQGQSNTLAADAAVVLNIWMVIVFRIYEAERTCRNQQDPVPSIDSAVALWIGKEQKEGKYDQGWSLYSIAQTTRQSFGFAEGEAQINTDLMQRFNKLQTATASCSTEDGRLDFYFQSRELIHTLSKLLILAFIGHIVGSKNNVELYGLSVLPQSYACDESIGDNMHYTFVTHFDVEVPLTDEIKDQLAAFLRCQRITMDDLAYGQSADAGLKEFLDEMDTRLNYFSQSDKFLPMAGYEPNSDVSEVSRLDLDAQVIKHMMAVRSYDAAREIFQYGMNSYLDDGTGYRSFQSLLNNSNRSDVPMYQIYADFYSDSFAEDLFSGALAPTGEYASTSRWELSNVVFRILQSVVSYTLIYLKMEDSARSCSDGLMDISQKDWDSAVALFVGSSEGLLPGGLEAGEGNFLYGLSKEICDDVSQCGASETALNEALLLQFANGRDAAAEGNCDFLRRLVTDEIGPTLTTLLVQSMLIFSIYSQDSTDAMYANYLPTAYANAKVVIPLVNKVNSTSSTTLENVYADYSGLDDQKPLDRITVALAYALRTMGVDCNDVGTPVEYPEYSLCLGDGDVNVPDEAPAADTPTDLGDGLYVTTTYVQDRANIAKDIVDIKELLSSNSINLAKAIYEEGKNSIEFDDNGKFDEVRSFQSFSTDWSEAMLDDPLFNTFAYALRGEDGKFMSKDVRNYANSLVEDAFKSASGSSKMLPVESMLALNLWMYIAHILYEMLKECRKKQIEDDRGIHLVDIVVAYWIGDGQVAGSADNGNLLYAMAEQAGALFNMDQGGQTRTNTNILKLFNKAKHEISLPGSCSDSSSSYLRLSGVVNDIISLMMVPLIQNLIHSLRNDDRPRVKLYAHAVVPLAAGCAPGTFEYLKAKLLKMSYNVIEVEDIIQSIRSIYPCLGLSCDDIGVHQTEMTGDANLCKDPDIFTSLAGYKPASNVGEYARLDLDIRLMDIMLEMKSYSAASNLYVYGRHVTEDNMGSMSLFHLATTSERKIVPDYDSFVRYYGNKYDDPSNYADHIINSALQDSGGNQWSDAQRKVIVMKSAQILVMYFGALQSLFEAVSDCDSSASADAVGYSDKWDQGAALLIGSLEGAQVNGTQLGYMYYDLAQDHCQDFGTCADANGGVTINEQLVTLLYSGRGAALSNGCSGISKAAREIASLLLIPVIQGALYSAIQLSKTSGPDADLHRAEGYVYSRALLPLVASANWGASETIDTYLGFPGPSSTQKTASEVFAAFAMVYPKMGVDCELIGTIEGNDPCSGVVYDEGMDTNLIWIIVGSVLGACALGTCLFLFCRKRKSKARLPENNPRFVTPETGELNHSMDLLEKAFSRESRICTTSGDETVALAEDLHNDASPGDDDDFEEVTALKSKMDSSDMDII